MKVTWVKGDLSSHKGVELATVAARMAHPGDSKHVLALRESLPYCSPGHTPAGLEKVPVVLFSSYYKDGVWRSYTGCVLLEFNRLGSREEACRLRNQIVMFNQPLLAFIGAGGMSVKVVIRYVLPDGSLPDTEEKAACFHALAYRRAVEHYQLQLRRDVSLKEPLLNAGCRFSYDPGCYYNPGSLPVKMEQPDAMPHDSWGGERKGGTDDPYAAVLPGMERMKKMELLFETSLADALKEKGTDSYDEGGKELITAVASRCFASGLGEEDTVRWLYFHLGDKNPQILIRQTVRNVYQLKKKFGGKPCLPSSMNLLVRMEEFLKRRYEFRRNLVRGEVEYRERHSFCFRFRAVTPEVLNGICLNAMEEGLDMWDKDVRRYIYSPRVPDFHPVQDFLLNLPAWDGTDRIRQLADTVPVSDPEWRNRFYIWFIGMVAHWYKRDRLYANCLVPILVGGQGASKSVFFRLLLPPELQEYHAENINLENKSETELLLARNVLVTIDEFDRLSKKYQADLKHLIQKPVVKVRRPQQKTFESLLRLASFSATANPMDLLTDPTGNRRYLCVQLNGPIDISRPIDYPQLYAQALAAIRSGERYWLNTEEEVQLNESNDDFRQLPLEIQYLFSYFRIPEQDEEGELFSAVELLDHISSRSRRKFSNTSSLHFARMLNASGVKRVHTRFGNQYLLVRKQR